MIARNVNSLLQQLLSLLLHVVPVQVFVSFLPYTSCTFMFTDYNKKISFSTSAAAEQHNMQHLSPNLNYEKHGVMMAV